MYNFKSSNGTFKGYAGECMFKLTERNVVLTRFFYRKKYFDIFGKYLNNDQLEFLDKNWYSLDAIRIDYANNRKVVLYEVKTKIKYDNPKPHWKTSFTESTVALYKQAIKLGFEVKVATVWLLDAWNYDVQIEDFMTADYYIDEPKGNYDKAQPYSVFGESARSN